MAGDPFRHVRPGQRLEVPAAAYNAFLDAARRERGRMLDTGQDRDADGRKYDVIKVRNASGGDVPRFGVLALTGPIIAPYPEPAEFQAQVAMDGETPVGPDRPFAILLEPLADGAIGRAVVAGIVPVRLTTDGPPGLGYAVPIDGSVINLRPAAAGPARIVWTDGEWALVHLGLDEPLLRIRLTASLVPKGSAAADPLVRKDGDWTSAGASITVHDPLGLAKLASVSAGSSSTPAAPVGTLGIAHRFTDAKRWELIALEPSAVKTEADDDDGGSGGDPGEDGSSYVNEILSKLCVVKSSEGNVTGLHYRNESGVCVPVPECPSDCTESGSGYGSDGDGDDDSGGTGGSGGSPPTPVSFLCSDSETPGEPMLASAVVDESPRRVSAPIVPCGVVIGCYRWPALAELQVRVLRETCGPDVPVLLSVDPHSDERDRGYLALEANHPNVTVSLNLARYGHGPGDLAAFWKGIDWARGRGIRVLAKLSHRFVPTRPGWLADGALDLLASRLSAATRACDRDGPTTWPLRTEAMLLDVAAWGRGDVRGHLNPARGLTRDEPAAESVVWNALAKIDPGHRFHPWDLLHADRNRKLAGAVWHGGDPASVYRDLAARYGLTLEPDFTTDSWWKAGGLPQGPPRRAVDRHPDARPADAARDARLGRRSVARRRRGLDRFRRPAARGAEGGPAVRGETGRGTDPLRRGPGHPGRHGRPATQPRDAPVDRVAPAVHGRRRRLPARCPRRGPPRHRRPPRGADPVPDAAPRGRPVDRPAGAARERVDADVLRPERRGQTRRLAGRVGERLRVRP